MGLFSPRRDEGIRDEDTSTPKGKLDFFLHRPKRAKIPVEDMSQSPAVMIICKRLTALSRTATGARGSFYGNIDQLDHSHAVKGTLKLIELIVVRGYLIFDAQESGDVKKFISLDLCDVESVSSSDASRVPSHTLENFRQMRDDSSTDVYSIKEPYFLLLHLNGKSKPVRQKRTSWFVDQNKNKTEDSGREESDDCLVFVMEKETAESWNSVLNRRDSSAAELLLKSHLEESENQLRKALRRAEQAEDVMKKDVDLKRDGAMRIERKELEARSEMFMLKEALDTRAEGNEKLRVYVMDLELKNEAMVKEGLRLVAELKRRQRKTHLMDSNNQELRRLLEGVATDLHAANRCEPESLTHRLMAIRDRMLQAEAESRRLQRENESILITRDERIRSIKRREEWLRQVLDFRPVIALLALRAKTADIRRQRDSVINVCAGGPTKTVTAGKPSIPGWVGAVDVSGRVDARTLGHELEVTLIDQERVEILVRGRMLEARVMVQDTLVYRAWHRRGMPGGALETPPAGQLECLRLDDDTLTEVLSALRLVQAVVDDEEGAALRMAGIEFKVIGGNSLQCLLKCDGARISQNVRSGLRDLHAVDKRDEDEVRRDWDPTAVNTRQRAVKPIKNWLFRRGHNVHDREPIADDDSGS